MRRSTRPEATLADDSPHVDTRDRLLNLLGFFDPLPADVPQFVADYHAYYKTARGFHARSGNSTDGWNATSSLSWMNTNLLQFASEIENPVMVLHGEKAHSRYMGEGAFDLLTGDNKELLIVPGASHTDLYDGGDSNAIPFDTIERFFASHLGVERG